jgi:type I restriction enzyme, R subunit
MKENPLRIEFYDRYRQIILEYNKGKDLEDTIRAFNNVSEYIKDLILEDARAIRENLDQETLAIFDLLRNGKTLTPKQVKQVKKVAVDTLSLLKAEKLRIERWRESRQITAQVKTIIFDTLQWLPQDVYSDEEVNEKTINIYQHVFTNYPGGSYNTYSRISA